MIKIYKPLPEGHYKRIMVQDPAPYLNDGWFHSISEHQESLAKENRIPVATELFKDLPEAPKQKRNYRKKTEAE